MVSSTKNTMNFEETVKNSFQKAKADIAVLKDQLVILAEGQEKLTALIDGLQNKVKKPASIEKPKKIAKKTSKKKAAKKKASKKSKKLKVL